MSLKGKTAIITGSSTGIGFAIAKALADDGAHVVLNGRDEHWLGAARKLIEGARAIVADLGSAAGCEALIAAVPSCDVLVNNLGIFAPKPFGEIDDVEWQRYFDVNVMREPVPCTSSG